MEIIKKVALAVFKDKQMLQVRSENHPLVFFTLGGKMENGETEIEALVREVKEEVDCGIDKDSLHFLQEFEDVAHGKDSILKIRMYGGCLIGVPEPRSEIAEIGWFDSNSDKKHISTIAQRTIFPWLKEHGYIN